MSSFSHYISELSDIFERTQDALAEKENKLKDKVKHNDLDRHRKVEEKQSAIEDELSSFSKCTDKIKSERLKEIQDAEEEINKSISEIEAQEKLANISYNISYNIIYCEYKEFALCGIWLFVNISLWGVGGMLIILGNEEKSLSITLLAVGVAIFYLSIFFTHGYYNRLARSVYNNYMTSANKHV